MELIERNNLIDTPIGELPKHWPLINFVDLCKTFTKQTGFDYSAYIKPALVDKYKPGTLPFIQNKDFNGKFFNFETDYFIPESIANNFPMIVLDERCLLISISGSIGNVGLFENQRKAFIGGAVAIAKFKDKRILNWLLYFIQSNLGQNQLLNNVKAGSHQNLILDDIRKIKIPLPPLIEQEAIAEALSDADAMISSLEKLIAKKKLIKQGMMQKLLTPKEGWVKKKLGEVAEFMNGKGHEQFISESGQYIVINSKFVSTEGTVFKNSSVNLCPLSKNDITIVMSDIPNGKALAKCFIVPADNLYALNQRIGGIRAVSVHYKYLAYVLNRNDYYLSFDSGSGQTNLKKNDVLDCPLYFPATMEEQKEIATIIEDIENEIRLIENKHRKYQEIKQGMMQVLLTGKVRLI